jgi:hypothetical protein
MLRNVSALLVISGSILGSMLAGCTFSDHARRVIVSRDADTLRVSLDPQSFARWSYTRDSLIIRCESCEEGPMFVERFEDGRIARFEVSRYDSLQWRVFGTAQQDSLVILENFDISDSAFTGKDRPRVTKRRIKALPSKRVAASPETEAKKKVAPKRAKSLRVSASEGVAVYKDKSKREVLKILPKGAQLPLLSREGDVYSVSVDGVEGFVESEAVEVE